MSAKELMFANVPLAFKLCFIDAIVLAFALSTEMAQGDFHPAPNNESLLPHQSLVGPCSNIQHQPPLP